MSQNKHFTIETDADGIATVTWDSPEKSMNVFSVEVMDEFDALIDTWVADEAVKGIIITSGKSTFSGGADLNMLEDIAGEYQAMLQSEGALPAKERLMERGSQMSWLFRKLETNGKPVVMVWNGTALGGAFEMGLACHHRIAVENSKTVLGLPEVKVGIFPGAGGSQRVPRLIGAQDALQMMTTGQMLRIDRAKKMGLVDNIVSSRSALTEAKKWLTEVGDAVAPWDKDKFRIPGGQVYSKGGMMVWPAVNAIYQRETNDNYPGIKYLLQAVYEGLQLPMDLALKVEARYFTHVLQTPEAGNMIRSLFLSKQELDKLARRPDVPKARLRKIGILGAGFMGAGVAYVSAAAGLQVVLIDQSQEGAEKGKAYSEKLITDRVRKGRASEKEAEKLLELITPTTDYAQLEGCDLVIEAVFEDRDVKKVATEKAAEYLGPSCVFASNTSTLPITSLAKNYKKQSNYIGIHFFSPVEKMMLVEIIMGKRTSDKALAKALDYVGMIKKTPIVVNDGRGFFTSRVVMTYVMEGHEMLVDGIPAAMIENAGKKSGMPVGPLSLNDEVAIDLSYKIQKATQKDLGDKYEGGAIDHILEEMVIKHERFGRKNKKGFYDYPEKGMGKKSLWPGLVDLTDKHQEPDSIDFEEVKEQLLVRMALETARCFEENILTDVREADVGGILGFGFAPYSGGPLSYIDMMGVDVFVKKCKAFERKHGKRFKPNKLLVEMAKNNETFYGRFNPHAALEAAE